MEPELFGGGPAADCSVAPEFPLPLPPAPAADDVRALVPAAGWLLVCPGSAGAVGDASVVGVPADGLVVEAGALAVEAGVLVVAVGGGVLVVVGAGVLVVDAGPDPEVEVEVDPAAATGGVVLAGVDDGVSWPADGMPCRDPPELDEPDGTAAVDGRELDPVPDPIRRLDGESAAPFRADLPAAVGVAGGAIGGAEMTVDGTGGGTTSVTFGAASSAAERAWTAGVLGNELGDPIDLGSSE